MTDPESVLVAVALGSNLGDRSRTLDAAVAALRAVLGGVRVSTYHDTDPVGVPGPQPRYLNAVLLGRTTRSARDLLQELHAIETAMGRTRPHGNAPRTLDLDLIFYGALTVETPELAVPHPRFRERRFVLEPLAEIAPDLRDPVTGKTITELLAAI